VWRSTGHGLVLFFYSTSLGSLGQSRYSDFATRTDDDHDEAARTGDHDHAARTGDHDEAARTDDDHDEAARTDDDHDEAARTDDDHDGAARTDDDHDDAARTDDHDDYHAFLFWTIFSMVPTYRTSEVVKFARITDASPSTNCRHFRS
jgi:hypothetical protein